MSEEEKTTDAVDTTLAAEMQAEIKLADKNSSKDVHADNTHDKNVAIDYAELKKSISEMLPEDLMNKEELTDEDKARVQEHITAYIEKQYLEKYGLQNINLEEEYELIKKKESKLSRNRRDAVVTYFLIFKWGPVVQKKVQELQEKENRTPEEEELLKEILLAEGVTEAYSTIKKAENTTKEDAAESSENEGVVPQP